MIERVKLAILAIILCAAHVAAADPLPGPKWVSGPDKAYNCTHYLDRPTGWEAPPRVNAGEPMKLVMRKDKVMQFTLAAKALNKRGKVAYELETPPPGAKLAGAKLTWTIAGTSGQKFDFAIVAVGDDGGRTKWPLSVTIADDKLVTAWSAGLGSVWPDCTVYAASTYDVRDLDGDGKDDVIYRTYAGNDGTTETHIMVQRGNMKFVEVHTCFSCGPASDMASDGTRFLIFQDDCCCIQSGSILRFEGDATVEAAAWQEPGSCTADPDGPTTISFDRDKQQRITGIRMEDGKGKVTRYRWRKKTFELVP